MVKQPAGLIVCTSPRSGSTLLCGLLADTGQAGHPWSWFHRPDFMAEWAATQGLAPDHGEANFLHAVAKAGRGDTQRFGMRLQQPYLAPLLAMLARVHRGLPSDAARLTRAFGPLRYVHLVRNDKVAQAVSLVRAQQTGLWHANPDGSERERTAPPAEPRYDPAAIAAEVATATAADQAWRDWFAAERIVPVPLSYEALAADPVTATRALCAELDIALPAGLRLAPATARLSDATSQAWAERFRASA